MLKPEDNMTNIDHLKILLSRLERMMLRMELSKNLDISGSAKDVDRFLGRIVDVVGKLVEQMELGKDEGQY